MVSAIFGAARLSGLVAGSANAQQLQRLTAGDEGGVGDAIAGDDLLGARRHLTDGIAIDDLRDDDGRQGRAGGVAEPPAEGIERRRARRRRNGGFRAEDDGARQLRKRAASACCAAMPSACSAWPSSSPAVASSRSTAAEMASAAACASAAVAKSSRTAVRAISMVAARRTNAEISALLRASCRRAAVIGTDVPPPPP